MSIALSIGQLEGWVAQGFFPFVRIGSCLMVAPVFGARFVPPRTRIILAAAITALVAPMIPTPAITPFSAQGFVVVIQQLLIGVALGFALQIVFDALGLAGQLLANSMPARRASSQLSEALVPKAAPVAAVAAPAVAAAAAQAAQPAEQHSELANEVKDMKPGPSPLAT